ncbi:MAG TPA: acyltransferase family protein [Steroidobacteraceae bacterium]|jgi:peptidoglycan/LPS O-acetylase OafA/YrhL|nr:acyltransferase family protein [Steroidobacteraceae bacterium]
MGPHSTLIDASPPSGGHAYRPDIDGLRAIAILSVIGFHAFPRWVPGGFVGVDVFFVISGYLISGLIYAELQRSKFSYQRFYIRRFRRIFPALLVVLAAALVYGWFALAPDEYRELGRQTAAGAGFGANLLFWREAGYFDTQASAKPLLHLWSLGVEEQFYITWPILIVLAFRRARILPWVLGIGIAASFLLNVVLTSLAPSAAFYLPFGRYWELLAGAALAYWSAARARSPTALTAAQVQLLAFIGLLLVTMALLLEKSSQPFPGWWVLLPVAGTVLLIAAPSAWVNRWVLSSKPMVFIGLISYPLYLWHWVLLSFANIANLGQQTPRLWRLEAIGSAFLLAWLTYRLIEHPIRFSSRRGTMPRALVASMFACLVLGIVVYSSDGAAFRVPTALRGLAADNYDAQRSYYEDVAYRGGRCFMAATQTYEDMVSQCVDPPVGGDPLVALWGDSHAASLYPGLRASSAPRGFRIAQLTASACPPLLGVSPPGRPRCRQFNDDVLAALGRLRPQIVVLEAHWALYANGAEPVADQAGALRSTIAALQRIGVKRIVVMGSLPSWRINEPRVIFDIWRTQHVLPGRSAEFLDPAAFSADRAVRSQVAGSGALFVSPLGNLCNANGCLLSADARAAVPIAWDNDHLTLAGSKLLVAQLLPVIMGEPVSRSQSSATHSEVMADRP